MQVREVMKIRNDFIRKRVGKRWQIANSAMSDDSLPSPCIIPCWPGLCEGQLLDKLETHATVGASG